MAQRLLIDLVLSEELCTDRDHARNLILRGNVYVNGHRASKPAASVSTDAVITLEDNRRAVSRAGQKLEFAFDTWHLDVNDRVAADVGGSRRGFHGMPALPRRTPGICHRGRQGTAQLEDT